MKLAKLSFLIIVVFFLAFSFAYAQVEEPNMQQAPEQDSNSSVVVEAPDLTVSSITFKSTPKPGQPVSPIYITITNLGNKSAAENKLLLRCLVSECSKVNKCDGVSASIAGELDVPVIRPGESVDLTWVPLSPTLWVKGEYSIVAEVDSYKAVNESDETNNINKTLVHVGSFSAVGSGE